ncbi:nitroreductase family protein [Nocardiopsis halophila]|uniref:hypothetical protein n=1 Tax=Nocardiopsis halophila TaxID=141692 RepID=UPI00034C25D0|nr:hypothetical protein [Nocardiopsis halophila]
MTSTDLPAGSAGDHPSPGRRPVTGRPGTERPGTGRPTGLPAALARALTGDPPGGPLPPGPRANPWRAAGAEPVAVPARERDLLHGLWRAHGRHRLPDGTPTSVARRPVPSAGGAYPVRTHLVAGADAGGLAPGRYAYDMEQDVLLRRDGAADRAAGWPGAADRPAAGTRLVLTVQPGRSFGRYRHRAWPLWIADTAYALAAVEFLYAPEPLTVRFGPGAALRALLGVPHAAEPRRWLDRGLAPEIPLAAVDLPRSRPIAPARRDALAVRRSPAVAEFAASAESAPSGDAAAERLARASGQAWVRGARRLHAWSVPTGAATAELAEALWQAHRAAAVVCYSGAAGGEWRSRPVSGFTAEDGAWIVHALAVLPGDGRPGREDRP